MSSKYTKSKVIAERRCGLKYYDKAFAIRGRQQVIEDSISLARQDGQRTWGGGWSNFDWCIGNVVRDIACKNIEPPMSCNLDEILTDAEMSFVATALSIAEGYKPARERKPE
jgi:hypothetical protein